MYNFNTSQIYFISFDDIKLHLQFNLINELLFLMNYYFLMIHKDNLHFLIYYFLNLIRIIYY